MLGFGIVLAVYLAVGEVFARGGFSKDPDVLNNFWRFAPIAVALIAVGWRRFRRVALLVTDEEIVGVGTLGSPKRCRIEDLVEVGQDGRPLSRVLVFGDKDQVVFRAFRNVWTRMQLNTLSVFLDSPVPSSNESNRARVAIWAARLLGIGLDLVFLVVAGSFLSNLVTADSEARAYQQAVTQCYVVPSTPVGGCYRIVEMRPLGVGVRVGDHYPMGFASRTKTYASTVISPKPPAEILPIGGLVDTEVWKGQVALVRVSDHNWLATTDHPYYKEQASRSGLPLLLLGLVALFPILSRLHPVIT